MEKYYWQGGGVEPALRKVVWKHLLGVYPQGINGRQRMEYMKQKSAEYHTLKAHWTAMVVQVRVLKYVSYFFVQLQLFCQIV